MTTTVQNEDGKVLFKKEVDTELENEGIEEEQMFEKFGSREAVSMQVTFREGCDLEEALNGPPHTMTVILKNHPDDDTIPTDHEGAE